MKANLGELKQYIRMVTQQDDMSSTVNTAMIIGAQENGEGK